MNKIFSALSLLLPIYIVSILLFIFFPANSCIHTSIYAVIGWAAGALAGFGCLFIIAILVLAAKSGLEVLFRKKSNW